jgi:hypothetical protein
MRNLCPSGSSIARAPRIIEVHIVSSQLLLLFLQLTKLVLRIVRMVESARREAKTMVF